jgi:hypothetical protein
MPLWSLTVAAAGADVLERSAPEHFCDEEGKVSNHVPVRVLT